MIVGSCASDIKIAVGLRLHYINYRLISAHVVGEPVGCQAEIDENFRRARDHPLSGPGLDCNITSAIRDEVLDS